MERTMQISVRNVPGMNDCRDVKIIVPSATFHYGKLDRKESDELAQNLVYALADLGPTDFNEFADWLGSMLETIGLKP